MTHPNKQIVPAHPGTELIFYDPETHVRVVTLSVVAWAVYDSLAVLPVTVLGGFSDARSAEVTDTGFILLIGDEVGFTLHRAPDDVKLTGQSWDNLKTFKLDLLGEL